MIKLTDEQQRMYQGECGPGVQKAMTILVKYGNAYDAERMIRVDSTHTPPAFNNEFLTQILTGVNEVKTVSSLHMTRICCTRWADTVGVVPEVAESASQAHNQNLDLFRKAGFLETFTCVPFLTENTLRPGMVFSWSESSAIVAGNSIFAGRGNRDSAPIALSSAITGVTPEMLLHKPENRHAEFLVRIEGLDVSKFTDADLGAIGFYVGSKARDRIVAVTGFSSQLTYEQLKYLMTPMAVSGAVALCHVVGVTLEAPTVESALGGQSPKETVKVGPAELKQAYDSLNTAMSDDVDTILFGCPHATISEIQKIANLLAGKKVRTRFWVLTADVIYALAKRSGYVDTIHDAGGLVITDTCISDRFYGIYGLKEDLGIVGTSSGKSAAYHTRATQVHYGSTETCVAAAVSGKWRSER
jgi:predicted aconitase